MFLCPFSVIVQEINAEYNTIPTFAPIFMGCSYYDGLLPIIKVVASINIIKQPLRNIIMW